MVITYLPFAAPTGIVTSLFVEVKSPSSVRLYWTPPDIQFWNGIITGYTVVYENHGSLEGENEGSSGLTPFMSQTIFIPQSEQQLVNSRDPRLVSLPLRPESAFIDELEEYHLYSFAVYQENSEGVSLLSESVTQEMPEDGKTCTIYCSMYF